MLDEPIPPFTAEQLDNPGQPTEAPTEVRKLTGGVGADAAIDITGAEAAINNSLKSVRAAGRLVCVGLPSRAVTMDLTEDLIYREVTMTGVSGRRIWDTWESFARVMKSPYYKLEHVIGGRFRLEEIDEAVRQSRAGVPGKMILYP